MRGNRFDEVIEEDLVIKDSTISHCILNGSVKLINCIMTQNVLQNGFVHIDGLTLGKLETGDTLNAKIKYPKGKPCHVPAKEKKDDRQNT